MINIKWRFNPGDRTGINDSGIETFRGQMITSLAREICQNSMDAVRQDKDKVIVEFCEFKLPVRDIPGVEDLKHSFKKGLDFWSQDNNNVDQAINFFKRGLKLLEGDDIKVLRISDFNTTGLLKSRESFSSPWVNLIMASGVSQKNGTAGGSFGIGKSAPFASTDLRTVFYSTLDSDGIEASQGVSRIATFKDNEGKETSGKGYYGGYDELSPNGNSPIYQQIFLDPNFTREKSGTDIYLIGFREFEDWKEELILALLEDFLMAIYEDKLEIYIGDIVLNEENLDKTIEKFYKKYKKRLNKTYNYYKVLTSKNSKTLIHSLEDLGDIEFKFLLGAESVGENIDFHRQALVVRSNGMKLFDRGYISGNIPFAGVLTLIDEEVNSFFRLLEPPRHDAWEVDLYEGNKPKSYVKDKIQEVYRFMRDTIAEYGSIPVADEMDAAGLGDYLPDDFLDISADRKHVKESITDKSKSIDIVETKKPNKKKEIFKNIEDEEISIFGEFGDGDFMGGSKGDSDKNRKTTSDEKGDMIESDSGVEISALPRMNTLRERLISLGPGTGRYKIILELEKDINIGVLDIFIKTEDGQEKAIIEKVINSNNFNFKKKKGRLYFKLSEETSNILVELELKYKGTCSMGVKIYGSRL